MTAVCRHTMGLWSCYWLQLCNWTASFIHPECDNHYSVSQLSIVARCRSLLQLKVLESTIIRLQKPILCRQEEYFIYKYKYIYSILEYFTIRYCAVVFGWPNMYLLTFAVYRYYKSYCQLFVFDTIMSHRQNISHISNLINCIATILLTFATDESKSIKNLLVNTLTIWSYCIV